MVPKRWWERRVGSRGFATMEDDEIFAPEGDLKK